MCICVGPQRANILFVTLTIDRCLELIMLPHMRHNLRHNLRHNWRHKLPLQFKANEKAASNTYPPPLFVWRNCEIAKDEIRLIARGTGMPAARRDQAATCWLVELGNGDKFLFD